MLWHSTRRTPFIRTGYTGADAALDRVRAARTDDETRAAVHDLQRTMHDDPPAVVPLLGADQPRREPPLRPAGRRRSSTSSARSTVAAGRSRAAAGAGVGHEDDPRAPRRARRDRGDRAAARLRLGVAAAAAVGDQRLGDRRGRDRRRARRRRDRPLPRAQPRPAHGGRLRPAVRRPRRWISRSASCATTSRRSRRSAS